MEPTSARTRILRTLARQGAHFGPLTDMSKILGKPSIGLTYKNGCSDTPRDALSKSEDSGGGHWKSRSKKKKPSREEDDLSQPWVCEEVDPFTPRICYFDFPKTRMPSHIKTYDGSEDPEDHLKIFQTAAKTEWWAMPNWCHMFNSTLTRKARVWFGDLPAESKDSYDDLKKAFLENYLQQKKCIKDPIELHNIKQRDGESKKDFVGRYKLESRDRRGGNLESRAKKVISTVETTGKRSQTKFQEMRLSEPAETEKKARSIHASHKKHPKKFSP
ncbi:reverse transcriptase domain-containing protein [Tanacetum coccineum]